MLIILTYNQFNLKVKSSFQNHIINKRSLATLVLSSSQVCATSLTITLKITISIRFTSKLPKEPPLHHFRPVRRNINSVDTAKIPVEPHVNINQVKEKSIVSTNNVIKKVNIRVNFNIVKQIFILNITDLWYRRYVFNDILEHYKSKSQLNHSKYISFMNSYDALLKNKSPYHKDERLFFSQVYLTLNNKFFIDLFQQYNPLYFREKDSYICSYFITNIPYKQMILIKTLFLFPLEYLEYIIDPIPKPDLKSLSLDLLFDLLRFAVCYFAQKEELPNCFAKDVMLKGNGLVKQISHNFQEGLKIYDPLDLVNLIKNTHSQNNQTIDNNNNNDVTKSSLSYTYYPIKDFKDPQNLQELKSLSFINLLNYFVKFPDDVSFNEMLDDYRPKLDNPKYILFMNSYDTLVKDKDPYHKDERLFFSRIYRNLNNRLFRMYYQILNTNDFNFEDSYFCNYKITNVPYKQGILIITLFLFPLEKLENMLDQDRKLLSINLLFDLLRFAVCEYALQDKILNKSKNVMINKNDLVKEIYANFEQGLKRRDPLILKYKKKPC